MIQPYTSTAVSRLDCEGQKLAWQVRATTLPDQLEKRHPVLGHRRPPYKSRFRNPILHHPSVANGQGGTGLSGRD
jgi:hypothetical protein